jgi:hypothetical protein
MSIEKMTTFVDQIGLTHSEGSVPEGARIPGISLSNGALVIDSTSLKYPGDVLYMAGLLATASPAQRPNVESETKPEPAHEMAAMAWSYAAALHLEIDPKIVFHEGGYQEGGDQLVAQFASDRPVGAPMLQWFQMTDSFPQMNHWLRTVEDPAIA